MSQKTKYLDNGAEVSVLAETDAGYIVQAILEAADGGYYDGETFYVKRVYDAPMTERLAKAVDDYNSQIREAASNLRALQAEAALLKNQNTIDRQKLKAHPDLAQLDSWLDGKVTHIVVCSYNDFTIKPLAAALKSEADCESKVNVRLLSLYGGRTGPDGPHYTDTFEWRLSAYSDGSGNSYRCLLATSEEDAKARIVEYAKPRLIDSRRHENERFGLARALLRLGLSAEIPPQMTAQLEEGDRKYAEAARKQAQAELASAQERLARAQEKVAKLEAA